MSECLRCGRELKDPNALYSWRCAQKVGTSTYGPLTGSQIDGLADQFLQDVQRGKAGKWYGKNLSDQSISAIPEKQNLFPALKVFDYVQKHNMKYLGTSASKVSEYNGFDVARFQSDVDDEETQYFAEVILAEKTVSEWHDFLNERFQLDIEFRKFLQYGGDSGAFDYAIEQFVSNPVAANLLSLGTNIISLLLGDGPPQMEYILKQLDGHAAEEKVTIVFEEKAWKKNTGFWAEVFGLDEPIVIHSKKYY